MRTLEAIRQDSENNIYNGIEFQPDKGHDYETLFEYDNEYDDEFDDEFMMDEFHHIINEIVTFPVKLTAENSRWDGSTGYTEADDSDEVIDKIFSFGNDSISLRLNSDGYYFRTSSHDRPTGFNIYIEEN